MKNRSIFIVSCNCCVIYALRHAINGRSSSSDTNRNHSEPQNAPTSLCCTLPHPRRFCACAADLTSEIITSVYRPARPFRVMNTALCLLKLLFFNSSVCQPEYIAQLGLLRDSTGINVHVWSTAAGVYILCTPMCQSYVKQAK